MSYRSRRRKKHAVELDITAFMNLIVVLVPFLLSSTVFSRLAILELNLPAAASGPTSVKQDLQLEVIIRPNAIDVADRNRGLIRRVDDNANGHDYQALSTVLQQVKTHFPEKLDATILSESDTPYDTLVQVMDAVRVAKVFQINSVTSVELFPELSIGDAPIGYETAPAAQEAAPAAKKGKGR
jgi:biopolymer transport protein ExbD